MPLSLGCRDAPYPMLDNRFIPASIIDTPPTNLSLPTFPASSIQGLHPPATRDDSATAATIAVPAKLDPTALQRCFDDLDESAQDVMEPPFGFGIEKLAGISKSRRHLRTACATCRRLKVKVCWCIK